MSEKMVGFYSSVYGIISMVKDIDFRPLTYIKISENKKIIFECIIF